MNTESISHPRDTTVGWEVDESGLVVIAPIGEIAEVLEANGRLSLEEMKAHARLIAAAPNHALVARLFCLGRLRWEPFNHTGHSSGELVFLGLRYPSSLDEFGVPILGGNLRALIAKAEGRV